MAEPGRPAGRGGRLRGAVRVVALGVLLMLLGAAAGAALAARSAESSTARATVLVDPLDGNPFFPSANGGDLLNLETEAQLIRSDAVATLAAERLAEPGTPASLLEGLEVAVRPNTQILDVDYTAAGADIAQARAQAFAEVFLEFRRARAEAYRFDQVATIQDKLDEQTAVIGALVKRRQGLPSDSPQAAMLREQITAGTTYMSELRAQLALNQGGTSDPGQLVTPATVRPPGLMGSPVALSAAGAVLGALAAAGVVALLAPAGRRVRHRGDLEAAELPLLGSVGVGEATTVTDEVAVGAPLPELPDSVKRLRVAFLTQEQRRPVAVVVAAAATDRPPPHGDPAPYSGVPLAASLAAAGLETVVVDAADGPRTLTARLGLRAAPGLTELVRGRVGLDEAMLTVAPHLTLVARGASDVDADDQMVDPELPLLVAEVKKRCDVVVVLGPPLAQPAGEALANVADSVVLEVQPGTVRVDDLVAYRESRRPGHVLGVVYVDASRPRGGRHR